jgi:hypothetical protein
VTIIEARPPDESRGFARNYVESENPQGKGQAQILIKSGFHDRSLSPAGVPTPPGEVLSPGAGTEGGHEDDEEVDKVRDRGHPQLKAQSVQDLRGMTT